jgi:hypothetical protein
LCSLQSLDQSVCLRLGMTLSHAICYYWKIFEFDDLGPGTTMGGSSVNVPQACLAFLIALVHLALLTCWSFHCCTRSLAPFSSRCCSSWRCWRWCATPLIIIPQFHAVLLALLLISLGCSPSRHYSLSSTRHCSQSTSHFCSWPDLALLLLTFLNSCRLYSDFFCSDPGINVLLLASRWWYFSISSMNFCSCCPWKWNTSWSGIRVSLPLPA